MKGELLREQFDACKEIDINVPIYLSAGLDNVASLGHPEWREIGADGQLMGQSVAAEKVEFRLQVVAAESIRTVQIVRDGEDVKVFTTDSIEFERTWQATRMRPGEFWYARIIFENGEMAWTSPIWLD